MLDLGKENIGNIVNGEYILKVILYLIVMMVYFMKGFMKCNYLSKNTTSCLMVSFLQRYIL